MQEVVDPLVAVEASLLHATECYRTGNAGDNRPGELLRPAVPDKPRVVSWGGGGAYGAAGCWWVPTNQPGATSDWAISLSWCGNLRSTPPV